MISVRKVEKAIGIKAPKWAGNCHAIAIAMIENGVVEGKSRYGIWLGPIAEGNQFSGRSFTRHGWIEKDNGTIVDPTRWVFEGVEPYIYEGPNDHYDMGGNVIRSMRRGPYPDFDETEKTAKTTEMVRMAINISTDGEVAVGNTVCFNQAAWIANLSPAELSISAIAVYSWLKSVGWSGLVPIDNWRYVMED